MWYPVYMWPLRLQQVLYWWPAFWCSWRTEWAKTLPGWSASGESERCRTPLRCLHNDTLPLTLVRHGYVLPSKRWLKSV